MTKLTAARREQPRMREPDRGLESELAEVTEHVQRMGAHGFLT